MILIWFLVRKLGIYLKCCLLCVLWLSIVGFDWCMMLRLSLCVLVMRLW